MGRIPKLLSRVMRAITSLREQKGSSVPSIVKHVRYALRDAQSPPRNVTMLVRSALKHAVGNGLVSQRAGKYRMVGRNKTIPVDSLEMAVDCKRKKRGATKKKKTANSCKKRKSGHDYNDHQSMKSHSRRKQPRKPRSPKRKKSDTVSCTGSDKSAQQKQKQKPLQQATPSASEDRMKSKSKSPSKSKSKTPSKSNKDVVEFHRNQRSETPFPDSKSESSAPSVAPPQKKRGRPPRNRAPLQPPARSQPPEEPPAVEDEPMDDSPTIRRRSMPRNISPKRKSMPRRENDKENDSLDEEHDLPPSYYD